MNGTQLLTWKLPASCWATVARWTDGSQPISHGNMCRKGFSLPFGDCLTSSKTTERGEDELSKEPRPHSLAAKCCGLGWL